MSEGPKTGVHRWAGYAAPFLVVPLLFAGAEFVLYLAGVKPLVRYEDPYVGFTSYLPLFVDGVDAEGNSIKVTAENKLKYFNEQSFLPEKPEDGYRIFTLGGSTTFGHPYDDATSFSGWLRAYLPEADPSRYWEVVNCGGISYASYRLALVMEELCRYEPDLFIVYTGHNEFLERRTFEGIFNTSPLEQRVGTLLSRSRVYTAIKQWVNPSPSPSSEHLLPAEVDTILDNSVGPSAYYRDDTYANLVREQFKYNLTRMMVLANDAGVPILFVTPPSNLRDCSPFKSEPTAGLSEDAYAQFRRDLHRARTLIDEGKLPDALTALDDSLDIDDNYAEAHYLRGRVLWDLGEYENARHAFERARDEDVCPLRATGPLLATIDQVVTKEIAGAIDFGAMIDDLSEHGVPGNDWFLDHVHPTIEGNRRLSLSIVEYLIRNGIATPVSTWNAETIDRVKTRVEGEIDAVEHGRALLTVAQVYLWGGKFEEARAAAERALAMSPDDWMPYYVLASLAQMTGNLDEATEWQRQAVELNPEYDLLQRQLEELETMREMAVSGGAQ